MPFETGRPQLPSDSAWQFLFASIQDMVASRIESFRTTQEHRFRLALCGHKAVEAGLVCLVLMVQGHLATLTLAHLLIASKTGFLAVSPAVAITFTQHERHFVNRWKASGFFGVCTFLADAVVHHSHYPGEYTEALLTGLGAFLFSVIVSFTPVGRRIDCFAEALLQRRYTTSRS